MSEQNTTTENLTIPGSSVFEEIVPGVSKDILAFEQSDIESQAHITTKIAEIDINDSKSIIYFGSKAQEQLTSISDKMLDGVKNKDLGSAGIGIYTSYIGKKSCAVSRKSANSLEE